LPRAKSTSYDTTRIELGVKERDMMETFLLTNAIPNIAIGIGVLMGSAGMGIAGYALYNWLKTEPFTPITDAVKETQEKINREFIEPVQQAEATYQEYTPDVVEDAVSDVIDRSPVLRYNRWWYRLIFG
jgi:hypothetical protein